VWYQHAVHVSRVPALHRPGQWHHAGLAAEAYDPVKAAKHADQDNFIPFIVETGGRVNKVARDWLDTLMAPEPGEQVPSQDGHPWNPQTRTTTETAAMQALVRVQPTCFRGLWLRSALLTSLSSWNRGNAMVL
jgi:hypothetical protein